MKYRFAIPMAMLLVIGAAPQRKTDTDWPSFGRDPGAQRYSPLTQITPQNVSQLQPAWSFDTGVTNLQVTPIVIDGLMYLSGGTSVFALEPETGKEIWRYDPKSKVARRGVAYWPGDGTLRPRLFAGVADGRLVSLDAKTGEPVATFGDRGFVDLKAGVRGVDGPYMLESPAVVYKNVVITGGANTEGEPSLGLYGDIRGWDARTGRHLWSFHTVPRPGEPGVETWEGESWKNRSGTNAWTYMTLDADRGLVFAGTGSPTSDFYGADRKGKNLYANSLLALDANTGKLVWFQQLVHHDIWDFDMPPAPILIDVMVDGKPVKAIVQLTKQAFAYVFDRTNGKPVWPWDEKPVPQTKVPKEWTSPTQPFPSKPPAFDLQGITTNDLIDFTPALRAEAIKAVEGYTLGPIYTPPTLVSPTNKGTIQVPGLGGGANWPGGASDPETGFVYVGSTTTPGVVGLEPNTDHVRSRVDSDYTMSGQLPTIQGLRLLKPPYGRITAYDMNKGTIAWTIPNGDTPQAVKDNPALKGITIPKTGNASQAGLLVTKTLLFAGEGSGGQPVFHAYDKATGADVWQTAIPGAQTSLPMTYVHDGRQYVVVGVRGNAAAGSGAQLIAFALPRPAPAGGAPAGRGRGAGPAGL